MNFNRCLTIFNILLDFIPEQSKAEEAAFAIERYLEHPESMKVTIDDGNI